MPHKLIQACPPLVCKSVEKEDSIKAGMHVRQRCTIIENEDFLSDTGTTLMIISINIIILDNFF
jgi:hypothetical protein